MAKPTITPKQKPDARFSICSTQPHHIDDSLIAGGGDTVTGIKNTMHVAYASAKTTGPETLPNIVNKDSAESIRVRCQAHVKVLDVCQKLEQPILQEKMSGWRGGGRCHVP